MTHLPGFAPWPADLAARYRQAGYWRGLALGSAPWRWAERDPGGEALVDGAQRWTFRQMAVAVDRLALGLLERGLLPGDHVVVQLPNGAPFILLTLALWRVGARPILALPPHRGHEIGHMVETGRARAYAIQPRWRDFDYLTLAEDLRGAHVGLDLILTHGPTGADGAVDLAALIDAPDGDANEARSRLDAMAPDPGDVALFLLSGGTTGLPKLIPRTHDDYDYNFRQAAAVSGFTRDTRYLVCLPAAHNFPLGSPGLLGAWEAGGTVIMAQSPNPKAALPLIAAERVTATAVVPAVAITWMDEAPAIGADLASLDLLQVGGARFAPEAARRVRPELGCQLQQVFGMAEGLLNYTRLDEGETLAVETQGRPMCPDDEVLIVTEEGAPVADGQPGELLTRGPYTLRGYFNAPEANARAFTPEGFYRTGDVVIRDPASGNLSVAGRAKDLINRGGEKISAEEIENLMLAHPAVAQAAAIAVPDERLGERVCAVLVLRPDQALDLPGLTGFLSGKDIAAYKLPERLEIVADLPLTNIGKIDKKALRDQFGPAGQA